MAREDEATLAESLSRVVDATARLVTENVRLARLEVERDLSLFANSSAWMVAAGVLALGGYVLACAGVALLLSSRFGWVVALLGLAAGNLAGGMFLFARGMKRLAQRSRPRTPPVGEPVGGAPPAPAALPKRGGTAA